MTLLWLDRARPSMTRLEHLVTAFAWSFVGALLGIVAGFTAASEIAHKPRRDDPVSAWVSSMRATATSN